MGEPADAGVMPGIEVKGGHIRGARRVVGSGAVSVGRRSVRLAGDTVGRSICSPGQGVR